MSELRIPDDLLERFCQFTGTRHPWPYLVAIAKELKEYRAFKIATEQELAAVTVRNAELEGRNTLLSNALDRACKMDADDVLRYAAQVNELKAEVERLRNQLGETTV